jgi:hypothetical protein
MLYREIIAVCSEIHTKHIQTLCGQNIGLFTVEPYGKYNNQWALKARSTHTELHISLSLVLHYTLITTASVSNTKIIIINQNGNS